MSITKLNNLSISAVTALPSGVGGKVLQVVTATDNTSRNTSSTSFVTASNTLSVSITPSSASNKIFIIATFGSWTLSAGMLLTIFRGATNLGDSSNGLSWVYSAGSVSTDIGFASSVSVLDSPSSTSALTYQLYIRTLGGTGYIMEKGKGSITAFEIGA